METALKYRKEFSVGAVLFNPQKKVLLVFKKWTKIWEFPQGKVKPAEELIQALLREVKEETGMGKIKLAKNFQHKTHYFFKREGFGVRKTVVYFAGMADEEVRLSPEHEQYLWCTMEEAEKLFRHKNHKIVLRLAIQAMEKEEMFSHIKK